MPFENYQDQTRDDSRYGRIGLALFLAALVGVPAFVYITNIMESPKPQLNHTVSTNEAAARRINELCKSLPKPENFYFNRKDRTDYFHLRVAVDYYFYSDSYRTFEETLPTFVVWFAENGWQQSLFIHQDGYVRLEFKKNYQTITLKNDAYSSNSYAATCSEREI